MWAAAHNFRAAFERGGIRPRIAVRAIPVPAIQTAVCRRTNSRAAAVQGYLVGGDASAPHRRSDADGPGLCVTRAARRIDSCLSVQERVSSCSLCDADRGAAGCVFPLDARGQCTGEAEGAGPTGRATNWSSSTVIVRPAFLRRGRSSGSGVAHAGR